MLRHELPADETIIEFAARTGVFMYKQDKMITDGLPKVASIIGVKTAKRVFDRMEKKGNIHKRLEE